MENIAYILAAVTFFSVYIIGFKIAKKLDLLTLNNKKVDEAIRRGNTVKAYYVEGSKQVEHMQTSSGVDYNRYCSEYKYSVNGKSYIKKGILSKGQPPAYIVLYYLDDPGKAFLSNEITDKKIVRNIMPVLIFIAAVIAMGMVYNFFN